MSKLSFAMLGVALLAAGCATPEQKAAQMQVEMDRMMQTYGPACSRLGYTANSDRWRDCVLQLATKDEVDRWGYRAGYGRSHWRFGMGWGHYW